MLIREMFQKPIDRDIKGVIKVGQGDDVNISQELDEYVVTNELTRHFTEFFANYKQGVLGNTDKMGVWISGFFGSGKSHFLKILSYLLANKEVGGKRALDYFIDDRKIIDPTVRADMKLCADMAPHTDVLLFNVDSKSSSAGKQSKDAIVSVFLKAFNEMLGYYGTRPHIADLERNLDEAGQYDAFKRAFYEAYRSEWVDSRHKFAVIQDFVIGALTKINFMSESAARVLCSKALGAYEISIETFAKLVADYIAKKGGNHHVVFLVDEIGQYIGDDSNLMLNLQTVTEDLGTACKGKAWVIVTSQQEMSEIIAGMNRRANDFPKIQGRFDTRLSLTSANVDAVIRKRLLDKKEVPAQTLRLLYEQKETIIKNLIIFNDSVEKKLYSSEDNFTAVYPFVPYQFNLLANVLTSIRQHGASGKHLSEGERSMLALFKESAVKLMDREVGAIIPFNVFYDALHRFLDHSHAGVIIRALENGSINPDKAESCFTVEVLKALFMIKYVDDVEANTNNLVSLLVDSLDADRIALKAKVDAALVDLVRQKLVQRNGDIYVFLTDEEQEINRKIDAQNVEMAEVMAQISNLVFEGIFDEKKYRYPAHNGRYNFAFNQFIDDHPHRMGQNYDIGVRILTPFSDYKDESTLRMLSGQCNEVLVVLQSDRAFFDELQYAMKITKFLQFEAGNGKIAKYQQIKSAKEEERSIRAANAKMYLQEAMKSADIYVNGDKAQIGAKDVTARMNEALGRLVTTVYHKLPYINAPFDNAAIRKLFEKGQQSLSVEDTKQANAHALGDVLNHIAMHTAAHARTSMKTLLDRFMKAPYGFVEDDVEWLVAKLFVGGDIAFTVSSASITMHNKTSDEIIRYITKKEFVDKLMTERRERADEQQKKTAREVMKELFGSTGVSDDDDAIMQTFQKYCRDQIQNIEKYELISQHKPYPGKDVMVTGKMLLRNFKEIEHAAEFFRTVSAQRDACLDFADDFDLVKKFFDGEQKKHFDNALDKMRIYDDSKTFIVDDAVERCVADIKAIIKMPSPYSSIQKLPELVAQFTEAYMAVLESMSGPIYEAMEDARKRVFDELDKKPYKDELSTRFHAMFTELKAKADRCNNVATFQNIKVEADALKMRLLGEIAKKDAALAAIASANSAAQAAQDKAQGEPSQKPIQPAPAALKPPKVKSVSIKNINTGGTWQVKSKADIDARLEELRQRLYREMEADTILNIEF